MSSEYEGVRRVVYGDDGLIFVPVCPNCGRFVKADAMILTTERDGPIGSNASCKKCGRVQMLFEGYV